jgi:hypothetical protein
MATHVKKAVKLPTRADKLAMTVKRSQCNARNPTLVAPFKGRSRFVQADDNCQQ